MASQLVYLEAFERCTVTQIRHFNKLETLDNEIQRQLSLVTLSSPDKQAYLDEHMDEIVQRIRETWVHKYFYKFDDVDGGEASVYPTSSVLKANTHVTPVGLKRERDADGDASHTSTVPAQGPVATAPAVAFQHPTGPANIPTSQQPLTLPAIDGNASKAPAVCVPRPTVPLYIPIGVLRAFPHINLPTSRCLPSDQQFQVLPPKPQFSFTGPKPEQQQFGGPLQNPQLSSRGRKPKQQRKDHGFCGGNAPFQPLFPEGFDPNLGHGFRKWYPTFENIHTELKRDLARQLLNDMPRETAARCMEALFRGGNDIEEAKEWLSRTFGAQGKPVIFLSDDEDEDEDEDEGRMEVRLWEQDGEQDEEVRFWEQSEEQDEKVRFWEQDEELDHGRAKKKQKRVIIDLTGDSDDDGDDEYELEEGEIREDEVFLKEE